jgi:hypothetical protein
MRKYFSFFRNQEHAWCRTEVFTRNLFINITATLTCLASLSLSDTSCCLDFHPETWVQLLLLRLSLLNLRMTSETLIGVEPLNNLMSDHPATQHYKMPSQAWTLKRLGGIKIFFYPLKHEIHLNNTLFYKFSSYLKENTTRPDQSFQMRAMWFFALFPRGNW